MRFRVEQTKDGSSTLFDTEVGECFKSRHAAATEVEAVFFRPALRDNPWLGRTKPFRILELGLGLGTNLQHAAQVVNELPGIEIHFTTIERDLAGAEKFIEEGLASAELRSIISQNKLDLPRFNAELLLGDFAEVLTRLHAGQEKFHAIFFDPFSPKANPEAWQPNIFQMAADLLMPGGRLATYSVSRLAKDGCLSAGLQVQKRELPEILQKRSALLAIKSESIENKP